MSEFISWCENYRWYLLVIGIITIALYIGVILIIFSIIGFVNYSGFSGDENLSSAYKQALVKQYGHLSKCPVCSKKLNLVELNYVCSHCNSILEFKKNDGIVDYYKLLIQDDNYSSDFDSKIYPIYDWKLLIEHKVRATEFLTGKFKKRDYFILSILNLDELGITIDSKEKIYFLEKYASVMEGRAVRNYVGGSTRVAKGVNVHLGQAESHDELRILDSGSFVITDKRIIFTGKLRNYSLPLKKIIGVSESNNGLIVNSSNRQKSQTFVINSANLAKIIINNFATQEI